jgi:glucoamylase
MPLCWSHAEYVGLVRSRRDGVVFDRIEPAYERYVTQPRGSHFEIWTFRHRIRRIPRGKTLRLIIGAAAVVEFTTDEWQKRRDCKTQPSGLPDLHFADLPTAELPACAAVEFTFRWIEGNKWEGRNFRVTVDQFERYREP